ncbi:single-stranded-DNA-specific exonuclease RecJ [Magnetovibrio sp.]|uniref:single-stranded-DNA-specific exonuclease RecJ n=1 Tax=Magnetovibrio sp. TaxID=2024836 RepID=UPI002F94A6C1
MPSDHGVREVFADGKLSLTGKRWLLKETDDRQALAISQRLRVPEVVGRVLASRDLDVETAGGFLDPKLKTHLPDPGHLKDMDKAATRIADAVQAGENIAIFGDYDVDGATSSALLKRFLQAAGANVRVYIPDRLEEGYGPNAPALLKLHSEGASLVVTVDCGQTSFEPLAEAHDAGLDVIVVDHHEGEARLPKAVAVVNPNRIDDLSPHGQMAAVGVAFLVAVAVNRKLKDAGWYNDRAAPDLMQWLDIVALGTVCDVVPLTGVNRALVAQGLKILATRQNIGLRMLGDVAGINEKPGAYHLGFVLGPRINAGGRVGQSDLGTRLLSSHNESEALALAQRLNDLNAERQEIEAAVQDEAIAQVEARLAGADPGPIVIAHGDGWHPGVVGIVASRLKEKYNRPCCVISWGGEQGTASGRSVSGADLGSAVIAARQAGLLLKGGGHAMAAGFTLERAKLDEVEAFLAERMIKAIGENPPPPGLYIDSTTSVAGANMQLVKTLEQVGPFGVGNPEPRFCVKDATIVKADPVGADQSHVRLVLMGEGGQGRLTAIAFRAFDTALGPALVNHGGQPFDFVGRLRINVWNGYESVQLMVDDAVQAWT